MTDPTPDTTPLVERLIHFARYFASARRGSDQQDEISRFCEEAATALVAQAAELASRDERLGVIHREADATRVSLCAILGVESDGRPLSLLGRLAAERLGASADPPNRAPLLAQLDELTGPEMASACGNEVVALIRDAIAAIRTDARVIEASRVTLGGWHDWARKLAGITGSQVFPKELQQAIAGLVKTGRAPPASGLYQRAANVCTALAEEYESGLPHAALLLLREIMPVLKGLEEESTEARFTEIHFLAEPCRVGLRFEGVPFDIRVPDTDAKALLRALHENFVNDKPDEAARKAEFFRALQAGEVARRHHADLRHAMGHKPGRTAADQTALERWASAPGPQPAQDRDDFVELAKVVSGLLTAEPALDLDVFPIDPATGQRKLEGEGALEMAARLLTLARERGAFDVGGPASARHWRQVAAVLWDLLEAIDNIDWTDAEMSKAQFRGIVRKLVHRRHDIMSKPTE